MSRRIFHLSFLIISLLCSASLQAEVKLPALLSDGMVLQRDLPTHFWGMASAGEQVAVSFRGETKSTTADSIGHWNLYLAPGSAGGPFDITIHGKNTITIQNVLVGDVWVASGQSNMEWPLSKAQGGMDDVAAANYPQIRLLEVKRSYSDIPQEDVATAGWRACSPASIKEFSAIAYYFARTIHQKEKVPIGVIASYWGGTVAEAWTSMGALASDPALMPIFVSYSKIMDNRADSIRLGKLEAAQVEAARAKGTTSPNVPWRPDPHMWQPAALFNAMIAPLAPFPIRGVIWYQGESNSALTRTPYLYGRQFETLIRDWRYQWGEGDFPFLYVQIANFTSTPEEDWAAVREGQRQALSLRNTGMVVTIDIGNPDDVHPLNKREVGSRLALIARANVYGENLEYSGPLVRQLTREPHALRVWFDHIGTGLETHTPSLRGFEVAGQDGRFHIANVRIDGTTVIVSSNEVADPVAVRYGWANNPACDLFNREGLPASPFKATLPALH